MRTKLLKSFIVVFGFWWVLATVLWSLAQPKTNLLALTRLAHLAGLIGIRIAVPHSVSVLNALPVQLEVLRYWTVPVSAVSIVVTLLGVGLIWVRTLGHHKEREQRVAKGSLYRGISASLGPLPTLEAPPAVQIELRSSNELLSSMDPAEKALLTDVLSVVAANQEAFAGENRPAGSLLEQTLAGTYKALSGRHRPGLAAIVAAASELGKITAWNKGEDGAWVQTKSENREAARTLSALPSWWSLPSTDRLAVLFAVKYQGQPDKVPQIARDPNVYPLARNLLETEKESPRTSVVEEIRQKVYEQRDPETELLEVFERELAMLPFQSPGLPKQIPAAGWKKNGRAYLLENRLTEHLQEKLSAEARAVLAPGGRDKSARISQMTAALLRVFHNKGWLVTEIGKDKAAPTEALWVIMAGKLEFTRVIILELPPDLVERLPAKDSYYEVTVKRPQFQAVMQSNVSKDDLMELGGLLRPKSTPAAKPQEPAPAVAVKPSASEGKPAS